MIAQVLRKVEANEISAMKAYNLIYRRKVKLRRAYFIKLKLVLEESKTLSILFRMLFFIPLPIFIVRFLMRKRTKGEKYIPLKFYKGTEIKVVNDEVKMIIKTI